MKLVPVVDLNLVTDCGEQVFPIIGYALVQDTPSPIAKVYKRWNVNGKVGTSEENSHAGALGDSDAST